MKGTYGTLSIDAHGKFSYTVDNGRDSNANKLAEGATGSDTFTILVKDEHAGKNVADTFYVTITDSEGGISAPVKVEVNITGTNDAPLLNLEKVLLLREGQTESDSGMGR